MISPTKALIYKSCSEANNMLKIHEKPTVRVDYMNGSYYEGSFFKNLEYEGFGYIGNSNYPDYPGFYGLFSETEGYMAEFDSSEEWKHQLEFLKGVTSEYFLDSEKYIREKRPDIKEYPWLKLKVLREAHRQETTTIE